MIEKIAKWGLAWTAMLGVFYIVGIACAGTVETGEAESARYTRACAMAADSGWTTIDCSAAAAYSAVLTKNTRYIVQAQGGNPYIRTATASSGQDADSNDGYLPQGSWWELFVPDAARYISCDGSADSSYLVFVECQ